MEDAQIVGLFFERDETAIEETANKYGRYCLTIAENVLSDFRDAEECVNDTWLRAWNSIPPAKPVSLKAYVGRIARNRAIDMARQGKTADKATVCIDELSEVLKADTEGPGEEEVTEVLNKFLAKLSPAERKIFVRRYFYSDSIEDIASRYNKSANNVKVTLNRTRKKLKGILEEM